MQTREWDYWARIANEVMLEPKRQGDWLAWQKFRAGLESITGE